MTEICLFIITAKSQMVILNTFCFVDTVHELLDHPSQKIYVYILSLQSCYIFMKSSVHNLVYSCVFVIYLFVLFYVTFCKRWANRTFQRDADTEEPGRCSLFFNEPSGSFICPVYNTDTWDLGLKSVFPCQYHKRCTIT